MHLIKKRVGRTVLVTEVERLIDPTCANYLQENAIRVLGQPLPKNEEANDANNWDEPGDLSFAYELGLAPSRGGPEREAGCGISRGGRDRRTGTARDHRHAASLRDRLEDATTSEEKDMLLGDMIELNADGTIKEGGIMNRATMSLEFIPDEASRKL
jgi:trigger factor